MVSEAFFARRIRVRYFDFIIAVVSEGQAFVWPQRLGERLDESTAIKDRLRSTIPLDAIVY